MQKMAVEIPLFFKLYMYWGPQRNCILVTHEYAKLYVNFLYDEYYKLFENVRRCCLFARTILVNDSIFMIKLTKNICTTIIPLSQTLIIILLFFKHFIPSSTSCFEGGSIVCFLVLCAGLFWTFVSVESRYLKYSTQLPGTCSLVLTISPLLFLIMFSLGLNSCVINVL